MVLELPCPFCGGEAERRNPDHPHGGIVNCKNCGAEAFGPKWNRRAALEPAPKPAGGETVECLFPNCDAWGATEWFDRLANAIHAQDGAVVEGDDLKVETYRSIAASSAMRLVREFETQVRSALSAAPVPSTDGGVDVGEMVDALETLLEVHDALGAGKSHAAMKARAALAAYKRSTADGQS